MPLTNPNKVVTEERLSEFYGQILPYMGGMPDVLANKFSKGDLYSTDEKIIGVWENGKPLYKRSINLTIPLNSTLEYVFVNEIPNIEDIIKYESAEKMSRTDLGVAYFVAPTTGASGTQFLTHTTKGIAYKSGSTTIQDNQKYKIVYTNTSGSYDYSVILTVFYTKTTDSPIAIGSDTDYSTDEKIVGTWIDGKPIWQNTVSTGGNVPSGATLILRTAMASTGYDTILYTKTS